MLLTILDTLYRICVLTPLCLVFWVCILTLNIGVVLPLQVLSYGLTLLLVPVACYNGVGFKTALREAYFASAEGSFGVEVRTVKHILEMMVFWPIAVVHFIKGK